jgi:hypothetical protein
MNVLAFAGNILKAATQDNLTLAEASAKGDLRRVKHLIVNKQQDVLFQDTVSACCGEFCASVKC